MNCQEMQEKIGAFADGEASPREAWDVDRHLDACRACRRSLRLALSLKAAIRRAPSPALPAELRASLLKEAALAEPSRKSAGSRILRPLGFGLATAMAFGALALVVRFWAAEDEVPMEVILAAHEDYERTRPLAVRKLILTDAARPGRP